MTATSPRVLDLDGRRAPARAWGLELWRCRDVLRALARSDFHARYKRASLGIAWAVLLPLVQAAVLTLVFSRVVQVGTGAGFGAYVLAGVTAWGYLSSTLNTGATSIVDGSGLTDKVWFPRALLPMAPAVANLVGLGISTGLLLLLTPVLRGRVGVETLWLVPGIVLLVAFTVSLTMVLSALHVYFRDVRYIVQAALLVWFYVTPVMYPVSALGGLRPIIDLNPMTGVIAFWHAAAVDVSGPWLRPAVASVVVTLVLVVAAVETYRRRDRLFVDEL